MERFETYHSRELLNDVIVFTNHALKTPPREMVQLAASRRDNHNYSSPPSTNQIIANIVQESLGIEEEVDAVGGELFFDEALDDIYNIMESIARPAPS